MGAIEIQNMTLSHATHAKTGVESLIMGVEDNGLDVNFTIKKEAVEALIEGLTEGLSHYKCS